MDNDIYKCFAGFGEQKISPVVVMCSGNTMLLEKQNPGQYDLIHEFHAL